MKSFNLSPNACLDRTVEGFYHTHYLGFGVPGNPDYLNHLKNTHDNFSDHKLGSALKQLLPILAHDLTKLVSVAGLSHAWVCCVPRAKALKNYSDNQLLFSSCVSLVAKSDSCLRDGVDFIKRHTSTRTTHLKRYDSEGALPYCGITRDTCNFSPAVAGKDIILVDDIYTKTVNIVEDAVQALFDNGAKSVRVYTVANTLKKY